MLSWVWKLLGVSEGSPESRKKLGVVALLYFIQGAPAAILWEVLPVYFRINGVSLRAIGGLRLLELPYSLKVFWSPLVHRYGDRRVWVLACMLGIAAVPAGEGGIRTTRRASSAWPSSQRARTMVVTLEYPTEGCSTSSTTTSTPCAAVSQLANRRANATSSRAAATDAITEPTEAARRGPELYTS